MYYTCILRKTEKEKKINNTWGCSRLSFRKTNRKLRGNHTCKRVTIYLHKPGSWNDIVGMGLETSIKLQGKDTKGCL